MDKYFEILFNLAKKAQMKNEMPVAALIVKDNKIISKAYNTRNGNQQTINHAEIIAIIKANKKLKSWRLNNCIMYVTLEPCEMCKTIIKESRISKVYYYLSRNSNKKQYNKTEFTLVEYDNLYKEKYHKILTEFWGKIR